MSPITTSLSPAVASDPERQPVLDADGLLRHADRWIDIPVAQLAVVELFLARPGRLVELDAIRDAYVATGGTTSSTALRKVVARIRTRLMRVDLRLHVVRGVGAILEVPGPLPSSPQA